MDHKQHQHGLLTLYSCSHACTRRTDPSAGRLRTLRSRRSIYFIKLLLHSCCQPWLVCLHMPIVLQLYAGLKYMGGPLAAKRTIYGSHTWSGGTIYFATDGPGDHLWRGTICGVTGPKRIGTARGSKYSVTGLLAGP